MEAEKRELPPNFRSLVSDFTNDLTRVFPENDIHWRRWGDPDITDEELLILFDHCCKVYPERFFDILYQNEEIFEEDSRVNTDFLPKMAFKYLYNCEGVSENTKKVLWKYLQLMLFTIVGNIEDKSTFGDTMNIFEGLDENILKEKLEETMTNISGVFDKMKDDLKTDTDTDESDISGNSTSMPSFEGMPNLENLQSNLKTLFDGKIGKLAKELAEEVADEFKDAIGGDINESSNPQQIIKNLMKNPNKIKNLMKTVSGRLDEKMKNGEISREDIMKEAGDFLNEMKNTRGEAGMNDMLKSMMKNMGGGLGKNAKINKSALNRLMKQSENKDKMMKKANEAKMKKQKEEARIRNETFARIREQNRLKAEYRLAQKNEGKEEYVFKIDGEDVQEKSFIHPDLLKDIQQEEENDKKKLDTTDAPKKKKKKKKNK